MSYAFQGNIERIVFRADDTGYTILRLKDHNHGLITACGQFPPVAEGLTVRGQGNWTTHPKFGSQLAVTETAVDQPQTGEGIIKYLSSGLIEGIGPTMAERLYAAFGDKTLEVVRNHPKKLAQVDGIGPKRAEALSKSAAEAAEIEQIMTWLLSHKISNGIAFRIYKNYGDKAIQTLKENPWVLADDLFGVGFITADTIAHKLGLRGSHPNRLEAGLKYSISQAERNGHTGEFRANLIIMAQELLRINTPGDLEAAMDKLLKTPDYISSSRGADDDFIQRTVVARVETGLARSLVRIAGRPVPWSYEKAKALIPVMEGKMGIDLSDDQRRAIEQLLRSRVGVLVGKPGCGKSTIVRVIMGVMKCLNPHISIRLAAPTGKAAQRLAESTGCEASTMHRLLKWGPEGPQHDDHNPLEGDSFKIDEVSMVDTMLAYKFVKALPKDSMLLLVGDQYQLPSVGAGRVLADIQDSGRITVARLEHIHRQAAGSAIISNAHAIHEGKLAEIRQGADFTIHRGKDSSELLSALEYVVLKELPAKGFKPEDIQILTGGHRSVVGTRELNLHMQRLLNGHPAKTLKFGDVTYGTNDRILITRNNYELGVFNGQTGIIKDIYGMTIVADIEGQEKDITRSDLRDIQLAYAITVHKSQGAQWPAVVMIVDTAHYTLLERNWLYTGITRAQQHCTLITTDKAIRRAVINVSSRERLTRLRDELILA